MKHSLISQRYQISSFVSLSRSLPPLSLTMNKWCHNAWLKFFMLCKISLTSDYTIFKYIKVRRDAYENNSFAPFIPRIIFLFFDMIRKKQPFGISRWFMHTARRRVYVCMYVTERKRKRDILSRISGDFTEKERKYCDKRRR